MRGLLPNQPPTSRQLRPKPTSNTHCKWCSRIAAGALAAAASIDWRSLAISSLPIVVTVRTSPAQAAMPVRQAIRRQWQRRQCGTIRASPPATQPSRIAATWTGGIFGAVWLPSTNFKKVSMRTFNNVLASMAGCLSALLMPAGPALAAYVAPAYAGLTNSTSTTWDYNGDWATGTSASHLTAFSSVSGIYPLTTADQGCGPGVACLVDPGDNWTAYQPNFVDPLAFKHLRVQFQFVRSALPDPSVGEVNAFDPLGFSLGVLQASSYTTDTVATNGVFYTWGLFDFVIQPNPDYERFTIFNVAGSEMRQVRVDSISIPEPGTLLLVAMAIAGLCRTAPRHRTGWAKPG